jgi:hypothetical protein
MYTHTRACAYDETCVSERVRVAVAVGWGVGGGTHTESDRGGSIVDSGMGDLHKKVEICAKWCVAGSALRPSTISAGYTGYRTDEKWNRTADCCQLSLSATAHTCCASGPVVLQCLNAIYGDNR